MTSVRGSRQYKSVVVQERPGQRILFVVAFSIFTVGAVLVSFWFGGQAIKSDYQSLQNLFAEVSQEFDVLQRKYQDVSQQLTNINVGAEIDRQTVEEVRAIVREHKQTIADLNEEIAFYKGLMAPTERERGLNIRSWEIYPTRDNTRYEFKLVLQQLAVKHSLLKGDVIVELVGLQNGIVQRVSLHSVSNQVEQKNIVLRFKYFQYIEGELALPDGFVPERIDIVAQANKPKVVKVEKQYSWLVQGLNQVEPQSVDVVKEAVQIESSGGEGNGVQ